MYEFGHALMDGSELIHVVALVRAGACVHKREESGDEEARLVHRDGVRPGENGGCLAVLACAVGEEEGVVGREEVAQVAGLPDKCVENHGRIFDARAGGHDKVLGHDAHAHTDGSEVGRSNCAVDEAGGAFDAGVVADVYVADFAGVDDAGCATDATSVGADVVGVGLNHGADGFDEAGAVAVDGNEPRELGGKALVYRHLASAGLVKDRHIGAYAE